MTVFLLALTILVFFLSSMLFSDSTGAINDIVYWIRVLPLIFLFPAAATWLAYQIRISQQKG
ncbi:hypothetical protein CJ483_11405 [Bacillus sp. PK3_68]|nr:hypothetical protein CJ483_11405 [Bacillus sp. PK3_68]